MSNLIINKDPAYKTIAKNWFTHTKEIPRRFIFYKFFSLWNSFNALYNLVGHYDTPDNERISDLVRRLNQEDANFIINKTKKHFDFFMLRPQGAIIDMQRELFGEHQPADVTYFKNIMTKYLNPDVPDRKKLTYIIPMLYRVRNNLTHGSKDLGGMDKDVIMNAVPILEILVQTIASRVFNLNLE